MVAKSAGVLLRVLENLAHDGIVHDLSDLGITHSAGIRLFIRLAGTLRLNLDETLLHLSLDLARVLLVRVLFGSGLARLESLGVLAHTEFDKRLANVSFDERRVDRNGRLSILEGLGEGSELGVCCSTVVVSARVGRETLDGFRVSFDGSGKVTGFEGGVAVLAGSFSKLRVDVSLLVRLGLGLFGLPQLGENVGSAVLG